MTPAGICDPALTVLKPRKNLNNKIFWINPFSIFDAIDRQANTEERSTMKHFQAIFVACFVFALAACTQKNTHSDQEVLPEIYPGPPPVALPTAASEMNADSATANMSARAQSVASAKRLYGAPMRQEYRENYQHITKNGVKLVKEEPVSTFSIDVDTASYSNIRRMLSTEGRLPPTDAVRIEEMINYFDYDYPVPDNLNQPFSVTTEVAPAPWNEELHLLRIGLKGYEPEAESRPDANLVFLVDVSGSMQSANKLPLVKQSLRMLTKQMRKTDRIALVAYAGAAGIVLDSTAGDRKQKILRAIDYLEAGGSTHGSAGIQLAYNVAQKHKIEDGINRVIIASDGDMNVGVTRLDDLIELIEDKRKSGVALTTLGFGAGNYNDALMEQLADAGNGNAAYIDNLKEARKVLITEMDSTLLTIASDVKIQVEFNPTHIQEYRLIGYENRMLDREDFTNDKIDAGDIGAGHTVTALYEVTLTGSSAARVPALRYHSNQVSREKISTDELAYVKLRYKQPGESKSVEVAYPIGKNDIVTDFSSASEDFQFASTVAGFGEQLRGSSYQQFATKDMLATLKKVRGNDEHGYRTELITLVELADSIGPLASSLK